MNATEQKQFNNIVKTLDDHNGKMLKVEAYLDEVSKLAKEGDEAAGWMMKAIHALSDMCDLAEKAVKIEWVAKK